MRTQFTKSFACALLLGGMSAIAVQPATAKQEKEEAAAPKLSEAYRAAAIPVQTALQAKDYATAKAGLAAVDKAAASAYEKYVAAQWRLLIASNQNDAAGQEYAINRILETGQANPAELPGLYFSSGSLAYNNGKFDAAAPLLVQAIKLGYTKNNAQLLLADSYLKLNRLDDAFAITRQAIATKRAAGEPVPEDWYNRPAAAAQKAGRNADFADFIAMRLQAYPTPENWRNSTILYIQSNNTDKQTTLDTLRLMTLVGAIQTREEYLEWVGDAADAGLNGEVVKAFNAGVASGLVNKDDPEFAKIVKPKRDTIAKDKAGLARSEAAAATDAAEAKGSADAWLGYGDYAKAASFYRLALKNGADANVVNTRIGIALAMSGDIAGAKQAFAAVQGPRAGLAKLWTAYLDQKTGGASAAAPAG